ncbi:metallophosphoesterase [Variovorax sp. KK3]|uniref:metallophosphoesterase n=1 Tax=Variovorax sp. KK3 TaxID=1855728 RepID=UPI0009FA12E0|nr:metallophosphoesterase [Variovorax sp. KK3]
MAGKSADWSRPFEPLSSGDVVKISSPQDPAMEMRIQFVSDLHLELLWRFPAWHGIARNPAADLLVLAGDIHRVEDVVRVFGRWRTPVLFVLGNHEFYHGTMDSLRRTAQQITQGTSIVVLDNSGVGPAELFRFKGWYRTNRRRVDGIRILGGTLWTDYCLPETSDAPDRQALRMGEAGKRLLDHRVIQYKDGVPFKPIDALDEHRATVDWLAEALSTPFDGKTLVITHHGPDRGSVHSRYEGDMLNAAFVSELPALLAHADVWMHGHVHDSFDYRSCGCRVVTNPRGYPTNYRSVRDSSKLIFENPNFDASLIITV